MDHLAERVETYVNNDRRWHRHLRLAHAKLELTRAFGDEDKKFWQYIIKLNSRDGEK